MANAAVQDAHHHGSNSDLTEGNTNLIYDVRNNIDQSAILKMIDAGADVNISDNEGKTALFYAVRQSDNESVVRALVNAGADINITDNEGKTPLLFCLMLHDNSHQYEGNVWSTIKTLTEVCGVVLNNGANVEETTRKGDSVFHLTLKLFLHLLVRDKNPLLFNDAVILLQLFAKTGKRAINKRDGSLNSPLHLWSSLEPSQQYFNEVPDARDVFSKFLKSILDIFLECDARLMDSRNENEETPLHLCRTWIAVRLLIDAGANPTLLDSKGRTPLMVAAMNKTFLIKDDSFYPDVELKPNAFWKNALKKKLNPWERNASGVSVLSILIESEASSLAEALKNCFSKWKPEKCSAELHKSKLIEVSNFSNCVVSVCFVRYHQEGIGKGLFGCQVFAGISKIDGREVAIKRIKSEEKFKNEIENLAKLSYKASKQIILYLYPFDETTDGFCYIMLELMDENLHRYLVKIRKGEYTVSKEEKKNICKQLLIGVHHMHEAGIIHCQLNPTNILIKLQPKLCLKIAGFGRSCTIEGRTFPVVYDQHDECDEKYIKYSESWLAPEVLNSPDSANHTIKSDMFSCFVVLYKILTDKHPYQRPNKCLPADIIETIKKDQMKTKWDRARISHCSESVHLLENVLVWDKDKESTAQQLLRYPFFWSNYKKIEFLKLVHAEKLHVYHPNTRRLRCVTKTIIGDVNKWDMDNNGKREHMTRICEKMQKSRDKSYQGYNTDNTRHDTLIHLLRLIRNAHVHINEIHDKEVARLVGEYVFLDYFPNLVVELFKEVKCLEWDKKRKGFGKALQEISTPVYET